MDLCKIHLPKRVTASSCKNMAENSCKKKPIAASNNSTIKYNPATANQLDLFGF